MVACIVITIVFHITKHQSNNMPTDDIMRYFLAECLEGDTPDFVITSSASAKSNSLLSSADIMLLLPCTQIKS